MHYYKGNPLNWPYIFSIKFDPPKMSNFSDLSLVSGWENSKVSTFLLDEKKKHHPPTKNKNDINWRTIWGIL